MSSESIGSAALSPGWSFTRSCHQTSRPSCIGTSPWVRRSTTLFRIFGATDIASSEVRFRGTRLPLRQPSSWVIRTSHSMSFMRSASESALKPPNTTVCGAPNLAQAARSLDVDEQELVSWVTIHEVTHAVQFSGAPWLRGHLAGLLGELIEGLESSISLGQLFKLADPGNTRDLIERVRRGDLMRLAVGEKRWKLVEQMQATMTLVEGHAEHVMDEIGAELLPSLPRLRAAISISARLPISAWRELRRRRRLPRRRAIPR